MRFIVIGLERYGVLNDVLCGDAVAGAGGGIRDASPLHRALFNHVLHALRPA